MKFQINPNLDIDSLKKTFQQNKKVVISDFLTDESINYLYNFFAYELDESEWYASYMDFYSNENADGYGSVVFTKRTSENKNIIKQKLIESQQKFIEGEFSYFFDRTDIDESNSHGSIEHQYHEFISSTEVINWFSNLIDSQLSSVGEFFASRFSANHFLAPHHDHEKGKIATVLNLSKKWHPSWGGCLHFMDKNYENVVRHVQPSFNKLSIFDIPTANGIPHYVSHVVPLCKSKRISYTGWYI